MHSLTQVVPNAWGSIVEPLPDGAFVKAGVYRSAVMVTLGDHRKEE